MAAILTSEATKWQVIFYTCVVFLLFTAKESVFQRQSCNYVHSRGVRKKKTEISAVLKWCHTVLQQKQTSQPQSACVYFCHENCPSVAECPRLQHGGCGPAVSSLLPSPVCLSSSNFSSPVLSLFFSFSCDFPLSLCGCVNTHSYQYGTHTHSTSRRLLLEMSIQPQYCHLMAKRRTHSILFFADFSLSFSHM